MPVRRWMHVRQWVATVAVALAMAVGTSMVGSLGDGAHVSASASDTRSDAAGTLELSGSSWLSGNGVDIYSNGSSAANDQGASCVVMAGAPGDSHCTQGHVYGGELYQCVEMINRLYMTRGWTSGTWWGDGNTIKNNLPTGLTFEANGAITYLNPGDVITLDDGGSGHAGVISSISGTTVNIANQNTGNVWSSATLSNSNKTLTMSGWAGYTIQGVVHHPSGSGGGSAPLHIGELTTGGSYKTKEGSLTNGWVTMSNDSATQIMQDGTLSGMIWQGGFYVKQGALTNSWVTEANPGTALSGSISDASGTTPIRIGLVLNDHTFWVREGLSGNWVMQATNTAVGYVSGNRIAALKTNGDFWVKEGANDTSGWILENGSVSQGAISGGTGGLIGVLIGGTLLVKQGSLSSGWVTEQGSLSSFQLSNGNATTGPRIGVIDTSNNFWVKDGVYGGWVLEGNGVNQAALSGNLIGKLQGNTFTALQGALTASNWIVEDGLITQIALWSPN